MTRNGDMRYPTRLWFAVLAAVLMASFALPAAAQSVVVNQNLLYRKTDENPGRRPLGNLPLWINRADCLVDDILTFKATVDIINDSAYSFEVWAGPSSADCTKPESRGVAANTCWLVHRSVPNIKIYDVNIRAQDIVSQNYPSAVSGGSVDTGGADGSGGTIGSGGTSGSGGTASGGTGGTSQSGVVGLVPGTTADCESGATASVVLTFMYLQSSTVVGTAAKWDKTGFDLAGPEAPSDINVSSGENRLRVSWNTTTPKDLLEWRFYCDPPPGAVLDAGLTSTTSDLGFARQAQVVDGGVGGSLGTGGTLGTGGEIATGGGTASGGAVGTGGGLGAGGDLDAGMGGGTATGGVTGSGGATSGKSCGDQPSDLVQGQVPSEAYRCGTTTGPTQRDGYAEGLENGRMYSVGMVGVDKVGNVGKLSEIECGEPKLYTDFFELYKKFGGQAGGGVCAISRGNGLAPAGLGALSLVGLGLLRRRKRND
jgi:hypothetical protein